MKSTVTGDINRIVELPSHWKESSCLHQDAIPLLIGYSQEYMKLSLYFFEKNLLHVSLLLCNRALESMLNALYIKQEKRRPVSRILLDDILLMFSDEMNMESLIFIQSLSFLTQENSLISKMQPVHLMNLIKRGDELLIRISSRLELPYETYYSILEN